MKITHDSQSHTLMLVLEETAVAASDEDKPGFILNYDAEGDVVGMEILDASTRVTNPHTVEFTAAS